MKIEAKNLSMLFKKKQALQSLSFCLEESKIYGLLGKNGAGKTTFMQLLAGLMKPTSGELLVNGENPFENQRIMESVCFVSEANNFKKELKIKYILMINALFYPTWDQQLAETLLTKYELDHNTKVKALSKGMESALGIVVGLASKAPITIFDEPYIGLDASSRNMFYELLVEQYQQHKRTIILSTHLIDEVSALFEEVIILERGSLLLKEDTDQLREQCFSITGSKEAVHKFVHDKKVVHHQDFMGQSTAIILGEEKVLAEKTGFSVQSVSIQDLMIYLTNRKAEVK